MIIGITGTDGAGKGAVVAYLCEQKGFAHYQARDIWLKEIVARGLEVSRETTRLVANDLRRQHGNDFLVTYYLAKIAEEGTKDAVIESIRAVAEADTLRANGGILLAVDAPLELRYERISARGSGLDSVSFEQFVAQEAIEMNDPDPNGMQKAKVMQMADYTIQNDGTVEELHSRIEEVLQQIALS